MNNDQTTAKQARKFVILEGIALGNRFFSSHTEGDDPTKGANGQTLWAEFTANPHSSRLDYLNDASYFGEDKTLSALAVEEKKALCQAFNEGVQAEKTARNTI